jgi:hypothetical protein
VLRGFDETCPAVSQNSLLDAKFPGALEIKNTTFLKMRATILTISWWRKISTGVRQPSISHKQEGIGEERKLRGKVNTESGLRLRKVRNEYVEKNQLSETSALLLLLLLLLLLFRLFIFFASNLALTRKWTQ